MNIPYKRVWWGFDPKSLNEFVNKQEMDYENEISEHMNYLAQLKRRNEELKTERKKLLTDEIQEVDKQVSGVLVETEQKILTMEESLQRELEELEQDLMKEAEKVTIRKRFSQIQLNKAITYLSNLALTIQMDEDENHE